MLRAIGLRRRWVQVSFLLEVSLIALLGVGVGVGLGVLLARNVVVFLSNDFRELSLRVPWGEVGLIALIAYLSALSTTLFAAWQAGRIDPAEALRYERGDGRMMCYMYSECFIMGSGCERNRIRNEHHF